MSILRVLSVVLVSVVVCGASAIGSAQPAKSVNDGVYTADQATRGEQIFKSKCGSCHYPGRFTGDDLFKPFAGKPLAELFGVMRDSMPEDNPGTLPAQEYGDVVAYFLQLNQFPTGASELVGSDDAMGAILFEKPK
jgi:mono/diheme cytochrome c family protein